MKTAVIFLSIIVVLLIGYIGVSSYYTHQMESNVEIPELKSPEINNDYTVSNENGVLTVSNIQFTSPDNNFIVAHVTVCEESGIPSDVCFSGEIKYDENTDSYSGTVDYPTDDTNYKYYIEITYFGDNAKLTMPREMIEIQP